MASDGRAPERPERLGWLTESAVQPRKRKMIEGVGASGVLDLKAALYRQQQAAQQAQADPATAAERRSRKTAGVDVSLLVRRNTGVEARDQRDREQLKTPADRLAESHSALERKAQLYERLAAGQHADEDELYNVDFLAKGTLQDELQQREGTEQWASAAHGGPIDSAGDAVRGLGMSHPDMERERERRRWEDEEEWREHDEQRAAEARRDEKIEALERIEEETREMRDAAARRRAQREAQAAHQRDRLKEAFLKKQLAAKLAALRKPAAAGGAQQAAGGSSEAPG